MGGVERDVAFYQGIEEMVVKFSDTDFESMNANMIASQVDFCQQIPCCVCFQANRDEKFLFCSEFAAEVYEAAGLIDKDLNISEFVPAMWDTTRNLQLLNSTTMTK